MADRKHKGKGRAKGVVQPDWSWVGTEVTKEEDITPAHRLRAAGIVGTPCRLVLQDEAVVVSDDSDAPGPSARTKCSSKNCKDNPLCLNYIGGQELTRSRAKEEIIEERLGHAPERRDGPAGLRNLGATCYANAFLQLWYHMPAFRNGVYACLADDSSAIHHLASVFASLQYSEKKVIDPTGLINALGLKTAHQQDAAEFSKLFMTLVETEFRKQKVPELKTLVQSLFEGTMEYVTSCEACGYESRTENKFLELEVNLATPKPARTIDKALKTGVSLKAALDSMLEAERMSGDNQYRCPRCSGLRDAIRQSVLTQMPPFLHLALMRFSYDMKTGERVKVKVPVSYPQHLTVAGVDYDLHGVIYHRGGSAYHGHFVCDVYDESEQEWHHCNDEEVNRSSDRPAKRSRNGNGETNSDSMMKSSKDAYMLVYRRADVPPVRSTDPPPSVRSAIEAENAKLRSVIENRWADVERISADFDRLRQIKLDVLKALPGKDYFVSAKQLTQWLKATDDEELRQPFDTKEIECDHGLVDPVRAKITLSKCVSAAGMEKLAALASVPKVQICDICIAARFRDELSSHEQEAQIQRFLELNAEDRPEWMLSRRWLDAWNNRKIGNDTLPTHTDYTILCEHGRNVRVHSREYVLISSAALAYLHSILGNFTAVQPGAPECRKCSEDVEVDAALIDIWRSELKLDKPIKRELNPKPPAFGIDYYLLPRQFHAVWMQWFREQGERPNYEDGLCEHGMLDIDPMMERVNYITERGWQELCLRYGDQQPVTIRFGANSLPGKKNNVVFTSVPVCEPCRTTRLSNFDTTNLHVLLEDAGGGEHGQAEQTGSKLLGSRRVSMRTSKSDKIKISDITKATTVKDIKVAILEQTSISPISQLLYYNDRLLDSAAETVGEIGILAESDLRCVVLEEDETMMNGKTNGARTDEDAGFGGTALVGGGISCPDCTLYNPAGTIACEVCCRPFGFD